jgi:adenine phosphoribosyltransferase
MAIPADVSAGLRALIRDVPDFPKPGVLFRDLTPLLRDPRALVEAGDLLAAPFHGAGITAVVGIEARGFLLAPLVAARLGVGLVPVRKPGKLPWETASREYTLEYGTDALEVHRDSLTSADRVVIVDDVLATGGTAAAASSLVAGLGAQVHGLAFVIELGFLGGRSLLNAVFDENPVTHSLLLY